MTTHDSASAWISKYESLKALQWGATWLAITPSALHVPTTAAHSARARVVAQREHEGEDGEDREHGAARQHLGREVAGALAQVVEAVQDVGRDEGGGGEAERVESAVHRRQEIT